MAEITAQLVKQLRERTGAGMMDCKKALSEAKGDLAEAEVVLRKWGLPAAAKKSSCATRQAWSDPTLPGAQLGVLVEVNCESDFVARTDDFRTRDIYAGGCLTRGSSADVRPKCSTGSAKCRDRARGEGKPEKVSTVSLRQAGEAPRTHHYHSPSSKTRLWTSLSHKIAKLAKTSPSPVCSFQNR
jgi:elongation factor Ts